MDAAGAQVGQRRDGTVIGDVFHRGAEAQVDELAGRVVAGSDAGAAENRAGIRLQLIGDESATEPCATAGFTRTKLGCVASSVSGVKPYGVR